MPRYAMLIDQRRCVGCMACIVACKNENKVPVGMFRTRVVETTAGTFPKLRMELRSELCNHCDHAPCVDACPTGASHKKADGSVQIDKSRCVGCKACMAACPYDARYVHPDGHVDKCSFCSHRTKAGKAPACVETCIGGSRIFGDLDDPNSEISRVLREHHVRVLLPEVGTKPKVFYINRFSTPGQEG